MFARILVRLLSIALVINLAFSGRARADEVNIIRDAEIENIIRTYATPIWRAAGVDPAAVHVYIVGDPTLNSFVAGGQNLFMNTGTILRSETPNQMIGIIAHETGHISGGHLARTDEALRNATIQSIIAMVAGLAATVAARNSESAGGIGTAAVLGGQTVAQNSFLKFSITQEASADHAALTFLDQTQQSARGLLEFFEILEQQDLLSAAHQDPYVRTHPLTSQRVEYVRDHVLNSRFSNAKDPPELLEQHKRMKAKLAAFLQPPQQTLGAIKADDNSVAARYARAVAYYRIPDLKKAVPVIDGLIADYPNDPYFHELKGQMLFENGHIADAVAPYEQAVKLNPTNALLRMELGQVQLETNDPKLVPKALTHLTEAVRFEDRNPDAWRFLAIAYGRSDNIGMMALALAEQGIAGGDFPQARQQAARALKLLPAGPAKQRALDIQSEAKREGRN
ncbi:MAG TPA: M48 family metalloprotease [Stellaceae bacterium]|nr:M48 family metalloprotease [Stellaceae bacterium]